MGRGKGDSVRGRERRLQPSVTGGHGRTAVCGQGTGRKACDGLEVWIAPGLIRLTGQVYRSLEREGAN